MASRRIKLILAAALVVSVGGGYFLYSVFAAQAKPGNALAQAPLNTQVQVPPAFIMAVDDSGSMTFHNQFPAADGYACWSRDAASATSWSFFSSPGVMRIDLTRSGNNLYGSCSYAYSYTGPRIGNTYYGIPPVDNFGFARSPDFNPAYFDPTITYKPWLADPETPYADASLTATRIDPRQEDVINLAGTLSDTNARSRFQAFEGMFLPQGTQYQLVGNRSCGGLQRTGWREVGSGGHTMSASCAVYIQYWPATFFVRTDSELLDRMPDAYASVPRTQVNSACGDGCNMWKYQIRPEDTAALQNFVNWFSFYGNRNRAMIAGMTDAMASVNNLSVGYFTINSGARNCGRNCTEYDNYPNVTMWNMADDEDKSALYEDMIGLPASGSTPNLPAVSHMGSQFQRSDVGAPVQLACQKNAGMLFTDGFSNVAVSGFPSISGLGAPFDETPANTMAAVATKYYLNANGTIGADGVSSLRSDGFVGGQVPTPKECSSLDPSSVEWKRLDCQSNLHMSFYAITLGGRGDVFNPDLDQDPYTLNPSWPGYNPNSRSTVDDIWHATVNTRGELVNARTPVDITLAMRRILTSFSAGGSPSGSIALTGARIGSGSLVVTPRYEVDNEGTDWSSTLVADRVTVATTHVAEFERAWEASERMASGSRRVFYSNGEHVDRFNATNLELEDLCAKPTGLYGDMLRCQPIASLGIGIDTAVDYLLGRRDLEKGRGGDLRYRKTVLGDIVNSTPVVSAPTDDYGYGALPAPYGGTGAGTYSEYLSEKRGAGQNRRYMVYVGANDGMLHAFDGGMTAAMARDGTAPDGNGGTEKFGYVPATALGHLGNLLFPYDPADQNDQKFQHRYYVDGPITVSDAHYDGGGLNGWSTVLVGTAGAGGRSVFALDVSDASRQSGQFDSGDRLWEISDLDTTLHSDIRANIGYVLGRPVIVPIKTADGAIAWKAVFGNGYNSASGKAVLFLVEIGTGTPSITMIEAEESGEGVPTGKNGLGNVVVVDRWRGDALTQRGRDGFADTVYAGDQKGALWKFDLRASSPADVSIPLFVTRSHREGSQSFRQPITGGITAAAGPGGGVMLYFGTGSFSFYGDPEDDTLQSLYAVNDTEAGLPSTSTRLTRDNLNGKAVAITNGVRTLTSGSMIVGSKGWYIDLATAERFVGHPSIAAGTVFMPTYVPDPNVSGCSAGGENWLFGLNARTGAAALSNVRSAPGGDLLHEDADTAAIELVDEQGNSIDSPVKDVGVMVVPRNSPGAPVDPGNPGAPPDPPDGESCWMLISASGADPMYLPYPCGRQSWRQIQ